MLFFVEIIKNIFVKTIDNLFNKLYNAGGGIEAPISLLLNGEERKLSDLLPQKEFGKSH